MNEEQQRITIAEACGWTKISDWKAAGINGQHPTEPWTEVIPDYLHDLNAMHKAVKTLPQNIKPRYFACLCFVVRGAISLNGYSKATEATAAQRAEAFLRTIDKWTTNPNEL
jgi:hypothetical protein